VSGAVESSVHGHVDAHHIPRGPLKIAYVTRKRPCVPFSGGSCTLTAGEPSRPFPATCKGFRLGTTTLRTLRQDWASASIWSAALLCVSPQTALTTLAAAPRNVVSYSDGPVWDSTGRLLFYLTKMDATACDLAQDSSATLALSESQLPGACNGTDPEVGLCCGNCTVAALHRCLGHRGTPSQV
jgi:Pyridoxamine 5'-phosphate oxidase